MPKIGANQIKVRNKDSAIKAVKTWVTKPNGDNDQKTQGKLCKVE